MLEVTILALSVAINSILGLAVITKNNKKDVNRLFLYLTLSLSAWSIITYYSLHPIIFSQIVWVRLVLASAAILSYFVLMSFAVFPEGGFKSLKFYRPATLYLFFVIVITQTPLVFKELKYDSAGNAQPVVAAGIVFFMILALSYLGGAVWLLINKFRHSRGYIKNQLRIVIFGVVTSFAAILITNFFLVSFFKNTSLISFAPVLTLLLTGSMAYAILKHRLFDLRAAIARTLAYVAFLASLLAFYILVAIIISGAFSADTQRWFYVALAVITAVAFQPLKKSFDRITNRFFFKDAYDPQALLDSLSKVLVAEIRIEPLLTECAKIIATNMRLINCDFLVRGKVKTYRSIGTSQAYDPDKLHKLVGELSKRQRPQVITDDLSYADNHTKDAMSDLNYAAAIKLTTKSSTVGYLLAGNKRSGDSLSESDLNILNIMSQEFAIAIENALRFEQISQFNVTLQQKIDEATKKLRQANIKLKELDATKDEFISMASHQLRTPLTTIKGYLSMVLEGDAGPVKEKQKEMIQQSFDSASRMVYLIADLLNVSRLQSGKFVITNKPTDLNKVVEGEIAQLKEQIANRQITFNYEAPKEDLPLFNLDDDKIRQVIMNFLDNALYYTPAGGTVTVGLAATPTEVSYTVTDTGVGVPKEVQHHLFSKFYRADNARKMRPDGTGLGLYMAKKVISAQGGSIIFRSIEGKGSTFGFSFPRSAIEIKS